MGKILRQKPAQGVFVSASGANGCFSDGLCRKIGSEWLANDDVHEWLIEALKEADAWTVGRYVVMPDHVPSFLCSAG